MKEKECQFWAELVNNWSDFFGPFSRFHYLLAFLVVRLCLELSNKIEEDSRSCMSLLFSHLCKFNVFLWTFCNYNNCGASRFREVYIELFRRWQWKRVALLAAEGQNFPEYNSFLKDLFLSRSIHVVHDRKMPRQATFNEATKVGCRIFCHYADISINVVWTGRIYCALFVKLCYVNYFIAVCILLFGFVHFSFIIDQYPNLLIWKS